MRDKLITLPSEVFGEIIVNIDNVLWIKARNGNKTSIVFVGYNDIIIDMPYESLRKKLLPSMSVVKTY